MERRWWANMAGLVSVIGLIVIAVAVALWLFAGMSFWALVTIIAANGVMMYWYTMLANRYDPDSVEYRPFEWPFRSNH